MHSGYDGPQIDLVVPCYNEADRLDLGAFERALDSWTNLGVIFVDDGSSDATQERLSGFAERRPGSVEVVALATNSGKAEAVRRGCLRALERDPELLAYWDADLSTPLGELPRFVEVFEKRPEVRVVLGSRVKLMGRTIVRSSLRHYAGRVFATAASYVLDLPVYDTQCGAKMVRVGPSSRNLFETPFMADWIFDVELIARYLLVEERESDRARGAGIYELPLRTWVDEGASRLSLRDFLVAPWELLRIAVRYRSSNAVRAEGREG